MTASSQAVYLRLLRHVLPYWRTFLVAIAAMVVLAATEPAIPAILERVVRSFEERDLSLTEFYRADEVFCTGTMGELAAVVRIDGRTIGDGEVGPLTRRLSELYRERTSAEGEPLV